MAEAGHHKEHHWHPRAQNTAGGILSGQAHQHGDRDENVAQHAHEEGLAEGHGHLPYRQLHGISAQRAVSRVQPAKAGADPAQGQRTQKVAQIHNAPVAEHGAPGHAPVQQTDDQEGIAGKQLGTGEHHDAQAEGKQNAGDDADRAGVGDGIGSHVGDADREADQRTGGDAQKQ